MPSVPTVLTLKASAVEIALKMRVCPKRASFTMFGVRMRVLEPRYCSQPVVTLVPVIDRRPFFGLHCTSYTGQPNSILTIR